MEAGTTENSFRVLGETGNKETTEYLGGGRRTREGFCLPRGEEMLELICLLMGQRQ